MIIFIGVLNASTARILTYILLNYEDENNREDDYVMILDLVEPDLIIAQEIIGQTGYSHFQSDVLDVLEPNTWSSAPFTNQVRNKTLHFIIKVIYLHLLVQVWSIPLSLLGQEMLLSG